MMLPCTPLEPFNRRLCVTSCIVPYLSSPRPETTQELQHALRRNAPIYASLSSYATTSDAHHMTQPPPSGDGAYRSMRNALRSASLLLSDVSYINAHATSTPLGDAAENKAIAKLMEGRGEGKEWCVSSTKGATGHLLGAAGAVEAIFTVLAVKEVCWLSSTSFYFIPLSFLGRSCVLLLAHEYNADLISRTEHRAANHQSAHAITGVQARLCAERTEIAGRSRGTQQ